MISEIPWLLLQWLGLFGEVSRRQEGAGLLLPVSIAVFDLYFCSGDSTCPRSDDVSIFEVNSNVKAWCAFGVMVFSFLRVPREERCFFCILLVLLFTFSLLTSELAGCCLWSIGPFGSLCRGFLVQICT